MVGEVYVVWMGGAGGERGMMWSGYEGDVVGTWVRIKYVHVYLLKRFMFLPSDLFIIFYYSLGGFYIIDFDL